MDINAFVGSKIKEYRKKKKMNQTDLGKKLGVSQNTISGYENGEWEVSYDNLFKIADIFEISIDDLFPGTKKGNDNNLEKALKAYGDKDLTTEHMGLAKVVLEKALTLEGQEQRELLDSIQEVLDLVNKINK